MRQEKKKRTIIVHSRLCTGAAPRPDDRQRAFPAPREGSPARNKKKRRRTKSSKRALLSKGWKGVLLGTQGRKDQLVKGQGRTMHGFLMDTDTQAGNEAFISVPFRVSPYCKRTHGLCVHQVPGEKRTKRKERKTSESFNLLSTVSRKYKAEIRARSKQGHQQNKTQKQQHRHHQ